MVEWSPTGPAPAGRVVGSAAPVSTAAVMVTIPSSSLTSVATMMASSPSSSRTRFRASVWLAAVNVFSRMRLPSGGRFRG